MSESCEGNDREGGKLQQRCSQSRGGSEEKGNIAKQLYFTTLIYDSDDIEGAETLTIKSWKPQTDETQTPMSRDRVRMHISRYV